jgi:transcriptional regulator with XRE-family HTH domain
LWVREKRIRAGKTLTDQGKALRLSVSYISAIELGTRRVPDNYALDVSNWLGLTESETAELCRLALQNDVAPKPDGANVPEDIRVAIAELNELRARLALRPGKASDDDIRQLAILARAALGLGLNLVQILEHRLPFVDPEFWLQVDADASHGPTFRANLEGKTIVVSEAVYHGANKQNPHDNHVLAHELGHLMAVIPRVHLTTSGRKSLDSLSERQICLPENFFFPSLSFRSSSPQKSLPVRPLCRCIWRISE